ncbi:hypothetical protein LOZ51_002213 [Ophidiomyces ophidiicola]|nr:hypothetical protein LOZ55_004765 [Ophidiomyces ophidiicola]KAI1998482.1 hypothetical protein LOZ51_002213 [Ophidiomyces ophidiicola]
MASSTKIEFSAKEFQLALELLDTEIGKSKNLRKAAPIKLVCAGGYVAVSYFRNRSSTQDIDYVLDPQIENVEKIRGKLQRAIGAVADKLQLSEEWINSRMEIFAVGESKLPLFIESIDQNVILWQGKNLTIYAAKWEWSLARKLKRIGSQLRDIDLSDAVAILNIMVDQNGGPLQRSTMKAWDRIVYTPIEDFVLDRVAREYEANFGKRGII